MIFSNLLSKLYILLYMHVHGYTYIVYIASLFFKLIYIYIHSRKWTSLLLFFASDEFYKVQYALTRYDVMMVFSLPFRALQMGQLAPTI